MNKYISILSFFFFLSCNSLAGQDEEDDFEIVSVSKVIMDESQIVYSRMPSSLALINDSTIICIGDYKTINTYNIKDGHALNTYNTDSLLSHSAFDIVKYIKEHCIPAYPDRDYILDKKEIENRSSVSSQTLFILAPIRTLDSVQVLVTVPTPYQQEYEYEGKRTLATVSTSSFLIANVNLNKAFVNNIRPLNENLFDISMNKTIPNPEFGSFLMKNKVYVCLYCNPKKFETGNEVGVFDIGDQPSFNTIKAAYPVELANHPEKWSPRKHFVPDEKGNLLFNSLFDIYKINDDLTADKVISLKTKLRIEDYEHISCFSRLKNGKYIIQSAIADPSGIYYYDFRLYNPKDGELSASKLRIATRNITPISIFSNDKIIFISKDEEHYYIETFKTSGA